MTKKEAYLAELIEVGRKHGFVLMHQDTGGAFEVYTREYVNSGALWGFTSAEEAEDWLRAAHGGDL